MRIAVLTTDTLHHLHFVRELSSCFPVAQIYLETKTVKPPFDVTHLFEEERDEFEEGLWFKDGRPGFPEFAPVVSFEGMNDQEALSHVSRLDPDLGFVFGTAVLRRPIIDAFRGMLFNLHGGDPERYRGLDSHLWSIYHKDFSGLVSTIHSVSPVLDGGDIVLQSPVQLHRGMPISELRASNTATCLDLTLAVAVMVASMGHPPSRPQLAAGRYYSFMPSVIKEQCVRRFASHTRGLA